MKIGEVLAACRKARGLSQMELAERLTALGCEVSNQAVSKWEKEMTQPSARQLLTETDMRLTDIAMEIGYNEPNYFSHVFRKTVGMTPKEYRQQHTSQ